MRTYVCTYIRACVRACGTAEAETAILKQRPSGVRGATRDEVDNRVSETRKKEREGERESERKREVPIFANRTQWAARGVRQEAAGRAVGQRERER